MKTSIKDEQGVTLLEIIVAITILGIALPSIFMMIGKVTVQTSKYDAMDRCITLAEEKMEEITGIKEANMMWYKNPNQFVVTESLGNGYQRSVTVTAITNWGMASVDAWEIKVTVTQSDLLPNGYSLVTRFTRYQ